MKMRRSAIGIWVSAAPRATTTGASTTRPTATPTSVPRQPRVAPTPRMIAIASTASSEQARNVETMRKALPLAMTLTLGVPLRPRGCQPPDTC